MTSKTRPPAWALHEAARRADYPAASTGYWEWFCGVNNAYRALADTIARHEQPPRPDLRSVSND